MTTELSTDERPPRPLVWVIAAALAAYLAISGFVFWRSTLLAPYSDMFEWVADYYRFTERGDLLGYLLQPHLVHRLAWTRGVLALDVQAFGAAGYLFPVVGALCLIGLALLLAREAARAAPPHLALPAAAFAAMLTLMAGNLLDASVPINTLYAHGLVFVVAALCLAETDAPPAWSRRALALTCLALGALGNAAALAAWPVMLVGAARARDWRWFLAALLAGGLLMTLYLGGPHAAGPPSAWSLQRIAGGVLYALGFLGLPWTRAIPALGLVIGAALAALASAAFLLRGGANAPRSERLATQLILYSLAAAAMAGLGRADGVQPTDVPLRYALFVAPLHVGLLMLALPLVRRSRRPRLIEASLAAAAVALVAHQALMGAAAIRTTDANRRLLTDFRQGVRSAQMSPAIHPDLAHAAAIEARMRRDGLFRRLSPGS